jgi:hypothetical protein
MKWFPFAMALSAVACSANAPSPGETPKGLDSGSGAEPSAASDAGAFDAGAPCEEPADARPPGATCILEAKGTVTDLSGAPLDKLVMTFCGSQCYGTQSDTSGSYTIPIGTFIPTADYAIHADGRPDHAVDYLRLDATEPSVISTTMHLPTLPPSDVSLPADGAPASSVTVGDLTLLVAAGTMFDLNIEDYGTTAGRILRVASVPLASAPAYAAAANAAAIYAIAPSGAVPSVPMGVLLKNSASLPASAAVEFLVLGDNYYSTPPNVGLLAVQATGHVSSDGQTIQTDPGQGISELTWLAVRKAN